MVVCVSRQQVYPSRLSRILNPIFNENESRFDFTYSSREIRVKVSFKRDAGFNGLFNLGLYLVAITLSWFFCQIAWDLNLARLYLGLVPSIMGLLPLAIWEMLSYQ